MKYMRLRSFGIGVAAVAVIGVVSAGYLYSDSIRRSVARSIFSEVTAKFSAQVYDARVVERGYRLATVIDSTLPVANYQLARLYFVEDRLEEARIAIDREIALSPGGFRSYYLRGLINTYRGAQEEAIADFETFLSANPESWAGMNDLAYAQLNAKRYTDAIATTRRGLEQFPENPWLAMNLGTGLLNVGSNDEALVAFERALSGFDQMPEHVWRRAYPGNAPGDVSAGLSEVRNALLKSIEVARNPVMNASIPEFAFATRLNDGLGVSIAACEESIGLWVNPVAVDRGGLATLFWATTNMESCSIDNGIGAVDLGGSYLVSPANSTTYTLTCNSYSGDHYDGNPTTWTSSASLAVKWLDLTLNGSSNPAPMYRPNTNATLSWQSGGGPYTCTAGGDWSGTWTGAASVSGSKNLGALARGVANPGLGKTYNFGMSCNPADTVSVTVYQKPNCSITPDRTSVTPPETVRLDWSCQYADNCTITNNQGDPAIVPRVTNDANYNSSGTVQARVAGQGPYTYTLNCNGLDGSRTASTPIITGSGTTRIQEERP